MESSIDIQRLAINIIAYLIVPLGSAFIGTWWGSRKLMSYKEEEKKRIRGIAIKALNILKKYAKNKNTFKMAENDFNTSLSIAEKRAILVALYKLGIPIEIPLGNEFRIATISFLAEQIDPANIDDIISQIDKGYGDTLFFLDAESYFNDNLRIKTLRFLAKKYVNEFIIPSELDRDKLEINFPYKLSEKFSYLEINAILVFKKLTLSDEFYNKNNKVNMEKVQQLISDIDRGLCDMYLNTDINVYNNICNQNRIAEINISKINN